MHLTPNNIEAIAQVAEQILGPEHEVTLAIRAINLDPDEAPRAWALLEALPADQRRIIAAMVMERMDDTPPSDMLH
ncbi:MAG: hypothetical protein PVF65_06935 [Sphingomonadales bacterium]